MEKTPLEQIREIYTKLCEIKRMPGMYAAKEFADLLQYDLENFGYCIDEVEDLLTPEYPDQQRIYNAEIVQAIEGGNAA